MKSNTEFKPSNDFALLLVGPPLAGKTNVAMCFPTPYFISTDRKLQNAVARHPGKKFFYDYIDAEPAKRWTQLTELLKAAGQNPEIQTIVIDNLTDVCTYLIDHIIANGGTKLTVGGEKVMEMTHWQPFKILLTRLITVGKSMGKMFIVCAHEAVEKDEVTGVLNYKPLIPGSMQNQLGAYFTDVWRCETEQVGKEVSYIVRTTPTPRMALGNSLNLPSTFKFTWTEFNNYLKKI